MEVCSCLSLLWMMLLLLARLNYCLFPFQIYAEQNASIGLFLEGRGFAHFQVLPGPASWFIEQRCIKKSNK